MSIQKTSKLASSWQLHAGTLHAVKTVTSHIVAPRLTPTENGFAAQERESKEANKRNPAWTEGRNRNTVQPQVQQFKYHCVAIRSGPCETVSSLQTELNKIWSGVKDLKKDPYSRNSYNALFRVQFDMPTPLTPKLFEKDSWPTRMHIPPWRGNPRTVLKALEDKQEERRFYIGNLDQAIEMETVETNMKVIYQEEIDNGTIESITAHLNTVAWKRQEEMKQHNVQNQLRKSAYVVIKAAKGKSIEKVPTKFEQGIIRRPWNGPVPLAQPR